MLLIMIMLLIFPVRDACYQDHEQDQDHEQEGRICALRIFPLYGITRRPMSEVVIEPAVFEDLDELSNLLGELFSEEKDFRPNKQKQLQGLRLIFEEPNRGRVFVLRRDRTIVGMINLLFTISTAEGGFVLLLEDLVVHDSFRGHGYGSQLLEYAIAFAKQKKFLRITLLTDRPELRSQNFFKRHGFYESHMLPMRLLVSSDTPAPPTL
jgi:GNAT superfamily N-acetyltransferase